MFVSSSHLSVLVIESDHSIVLEARPPFVCVLTTTSDQLTFTKPTMKRASHMNDKASKTPKKLSKSFQSCLEVISHALRRYGDQRHRMRLQRHNTRYLFDHNGQITVKQTIDIEQKNIKSISSLSNDTISISSDTHTEFIKIVDGNLQIQDKPLMTYGALSDVYLISNDRIIGCQDSKLVNIYDLKRSTVKSRTAVHHIHSLTLLDDLYVLLESDTNFIFCRVQDKGLKHMADLHKEQQVFPITVTDILPDGGIITIDNMAIFIYYAYPISLTRIRRNISSSFTCAFSIINATEIACPNNNAEIEIWNLNTQECVKRIPLLNRERIFWIDIISENAAICSFDFSGTALIDIGTGENIKLIGTGKQICGYVIADDHTIIAQTQSQINMLTIPERAIERKIPMQVIQLYHFITNDVLCDVTIKC